MGINVLSLCDGMSCGQIALRELGIEVDRYIAAEIDKNAIKVTKDNFPKTEEVGDVAYFFKDMKNLVLDEEKLKALPKIDLVIYGSPCRSLSRLTLDRKEYNKGLEGVSWLFYPCTEILHWVMKNNNADVKFMVENVDSASKDDLKIISEKLGVEGILINSVDFSAQERKRIYWTNIPLKERPEKNRQVLKDIMEVDVDEKYIYNLPFDFKGEESRVCATVGVKGHDMIKRVYSKNFKAPTLTACRGGNVQKKVYDKGKCRKLTPLEYRRLQTIPDWYRMNVADSSIYNMCGDGWTIEVIKYIFGGLI